MHPEGTTISLHYTLSMKDELIESTTEASPLVYTLGSGELMPGLEEILREMEEGEERSGVLAPEKAYGPANPDAFIEVPKDHLPPEAWKIDALLQASGPKGEQIEGRVAELKENSAIVDFNHPLAGKKLAFSIQILSIR